MTQCAAMESLAVIGENDFMIFKNCRDGIIVDPVAPPRSTFLKLRLGALLK
jgi:hypothetical protein